MATRAAEHFDLILPSILKPVPLWTGKQIISMVLNPNSSSKKITFNLQIKEKSYSNREGNLHFDLQDGYVSFRNGVLVSGRVGKCTLGGSKSGLVYRLLKDYSAYACGKVLVRFSRLSSRFIDKVGMTFGISDVTPSEAARDFTQALFKQKNIEAEKIISDFQKQKDGKFIVLLLCIILNFYFKGFLKNQYLLFESLVANKIHFSFIFYI